MATESSDRQVRPVSAASTAPSYPQGTSSDEIRRDIEQTRADLDQTVDTLEQRLHPRHLLDDLLDMFRGGFSSSGSTASGAVGSAGEQMRSAGTKVLDKLKQHPMPAAFIGAGIAWLMFEDDGKVSRDQYQPRKWDVPAYSGSYVDARTGEPYHASTYGARDPGDAGDAGNSGPGMTDKAREMASSAGSKVSGMAESARGAMSDWAESARGMASGASRSMSDYSSSASAQMRRGYESTRHSVERGIEDYPLAMGAAAMAVGVLAGLCLPRTRTEDRLMGEQADELKDRAKQAGQQVVESGKKVAQAGADAAAGAAEPGSLAEKVKHVARDVKQAAKASARREGLDAAALKQKGKDVADRATQAARDEAQRQKRDLHT